MFSVLGIMLLLCSCGGNDPTLVGTDPAVTTSLSLSPTTLTIGKDNGPSFVKVNSDTDWTVFVNNAGASGRIPGLDVSPLSGSKDATLRVSYNAVNTEYYAAQNATIVVSYYSKGIKQTKTISVLRKSSNP